MRTWTPSARAYTPIDGLVECKSGVIISSSVPSPMPDVLRVLETRMEEACFSSSGATSFSHIRIISGGGPGITTIILFSRSTHHPGAVPRGFSMARADLINWACFKFRSGIYPPRASKSVRRAVAWSSS